MKRAPLLIIGLLIFITGAILVATNQQPAATSNNAVQNTNTVSANTNAASIITNTVPPVTTPINTAPPGPVNTNTTAPTPTPIVVLPISDFYNRVTKKPFGIYITPKTSPVQPEKFQGYHTGADAETTIAEKDIDVPIISIAAGKVVLARYVSGYGGVMMIQSMVDGKVFTILYGHLRQSSFKFTVGASVKMGQQIAVLGIGYSSETDGERKHLHLGILNGASTNIKGYVSAKSQLSSWLDPVAWLKAHGAA